MWIEEMLVFSMQAGVGSVGAKLFRPDGRLQEAGIAWHAGRPARSYQLQPGDGAGYLNNLLIPRNCLAVSAACMMTPRAAFDDAGGMDPGMPPLCSSVDYCLKLREAGLRTVFAPQVEMVDRGPLPAGELEAAGELLRERWPQLLRGDPFYSPRFAGDSFELRPFNRRGEFQDRVDPLALVDRVRRAFGEGGVRLVVGRTYGKVRHELGQRSRHSG